jgi:murein DD-endopeptidase MepM/ murein hydrolase activator NlpD
MKCVGSKFYSSIFLLVFLYACSTSSPGLFSKQSPHDQYGRKITEAGLKETALGTQWFTAAEQALSKPATIAIPYKEAGYFSADKPRAVGLQFSGKRGQKLLFQLNKQAVSPFVLYADLWELNAPDKPKRIKFLDTTQLSFDLEVKDNTAYILRLQPELLSSGDYTLSIAVGPSLGFPVAGKVGRIGSIWGDARDAGARQHEGIDIFAPKGTPALAAVDGTVTAANENNLGGKVVWLRPKGKNYTLYYAHLDEQLANAGQQVKKGDTIGLVGNTGNARTTPSHLHFGIYAFGGAIDPFPFVNPAIKTPAYVASDVEILKGRLRLNSAATLSSSNYANTYKTHTLVQPVAVSVNSYRVALPDGNMVEVPKRSVQKLQNPIRQAKLKVDQLLLDHPTMGAARKLSLPATTSVSVMAFFNDYAFVKYKDEEGWIPLDSIQLK